MSSHDEKLEPVGGPIFTWPFIALSLLTAVGIALMLWRFVVGLGPSTALSDGYPWGAWKVFNVIVLTALGSGGYATAILVYVLNRGKYHPLARTAILTSVIGYTFGVIALGVDIGRPWNFYNVLFVWSWNLHSVLLEVAVCISTYVIFLWIEIAPPFFEKWATGPQNALKRFAAWGTPKLDSYYPFIVAAAITLPSMHQSSLGSLFLLAGPRVHPLWQTPMVPALFLLSCWFLGYSCVVIVSLLSSYVWKRPFEVRMIGSLSRVMAWVILAFVALRFIDFGYRGVLGLMFGFNVYSFFFLLETVLLVVSAYGLLQKETRDDPGKLMRMAMLVAFAGSLYRLDTGITAFMPGKNWSYFPSMIEMIIMLAFVAMGVMTYLVIVKQYAILPAAAPAVSKAAESR
ncbi:MAG: NrfD/PsrC family molybdoenzyme membrane anchor subunit [Syntrophobacteraceae bacterium]